ncbi:MAG: M48 family metallopeptidase [Candidatus Sericytochromatia bacterium]|nr:M48 family metallopeptidase [Candidatus Sericytochromatia bacterium]
MVAGKMTLPTESVRTSIDYVLVHELCHLLCLHHNASFYRLLSRAMPDWQKRKEKLEGKRR